MNTRIVAAIGLTLTLGTALASSLVSSDRSPSTPVDLEASATPEMIAAWKATAISSEYIAPKAPI